jgi:DNA polymerase-3 subunit beta
MQVNLTLTQLRAALLVAAKGDIRYYLNGVYVESTPDCARVVATNGHVLYAHDHKVGGNTFTGSFIIPRSVLEMVTKGTAKWDGATITIDDIGDSKKQVLNCSIITGACLTPVQFTPIEGVFPDYCRVVPETRGENDALTPAQFNPEYLALWGKVSKVLGSKTGQYYLFPKGNETATVEFHGYPECIGVMMPVRDTRNDTSPLDTSPWKQKLTVKEPEVVAIDPEQLHHL